MKTDNFSSVSKTEIEIIGGNINAYGVHIRFQATDIGHGTTPVSADAFPLLSCLVIMKKYQQTSTATTIPITAVATTSQSPSLTKPSSPSPGLSTGAGVGIGIGAAVAAFIGLVLLWLGWQRAKKRHAGALGGIGDTELEKIDGVGSTTIETEYHEAPETQGDRCFEILGENAGLELEGHHSAHRQELEGSQR